MQGISMFLQTNISVSMQGSDPLQILNWEKAKLKKHVSFPDT
jgi:hypothetical protein